MDTMECIFCGTETIDGDCAECIDNAETLGLDFYELKEATIWNIPLE